MDSSRPEAIEEGIIPMHTVISKGAGLFGFLLVTGRPCRPENIVTRKLGQRISSQGTPYRDLVRKFY